MSQKGKRPEVLPEKFDGSGVSHEQTIRHVALALRNPEAFT